MSNKLWSNKNMKTVQNFSKHYLEGVKSALYLKYIHVYHFVSLFGICSDEQRDQGKKLVILSSFSIHWFD